MKENYSTQRKPTQAQGKHANSMQIVSCLRFELSTLLQPVLLQSITVDMLLEENKMQRLYERGLGLLEQKQVRFCKTFCNFLFNFT